MRIALKITGSDNECSLSLYVECFYFEVFFIAVAPELLQLLVNPE